MEAPPRRFDPFQIHFYNRPRKLSTIRQPILMVICVGCKLQSVNTYLQNVVEKAERGNLARNDWLIDGGFLSGMHNRLNGPKQDIVT